MYTQKDGSEVRGVRGVRGEVGRASRTNGRWCSESGVMLGCFHREFGDGKSNNAANTEGTGVKLRTSIKVG